VFCSYQYNHNPLFPRSVFLGDSITANPPQWPDALFALVGSVGGPFYNVAHDGWTSLDVLADLTTSVLPLAPITTGVPALACTLVGANDFLTRTAAETYGTVKQIWAQLRAWKFITMGCTTIANNNQPQGSDWDNTRLAFNILVASDQTLYDCYCDDAFPFPYSQVGYLTQDGTHPNQLGANKLAAFCLQNARTSQFIPLT